VLDVLDPGGEPYLLHWLLSNLDSLASGSKNYHSASAATRKAVMSMCSSLCAGTPEQVDAVERAEILRKVVLLVLLGQPEHEDVSGNSWYQTLRDC
jgi:hypothetical protein